MSTSSFQASSRDLAAPHRSCPRPARAAHAGAGTAAVVFAAALQLVASQALPAQMPGLPVLQNAFAYPAIAVAGNVGYATDVLTLAGAVSWVPSGGRYILSGGAGIVSPDDGGGNAFGAGARIAAPMWRLFEESLGIAPFAGGGGAWFDAGSQVEAAAGVGIGWRRAFGVGRGVSLHTAPHARWVRNSPDAGSSSSAWLFRISGGVDLTITGSLGATIGFESGGIDEESAPLMARTVVGAGLSYIFR